MFDEVKIALKGGDGDGLGRDLMRLGGTEEGGGDAEAGNEEEEGGADHSSVLLEERDWVVMIQSTRCFIINQQSSYLPRPRYLGTADLRHNKPTFFLGGKTMTVSPITMKRAAITALLLPFLASAVVGESSLRGVDSPAPGVGGLDNEVAHAPANGKKARRRKLADVTNKFQMKLWYTEGIKWEYRGKHWCWQCVGQKGCNPGDTIITQPCRDIRAQRWQAVQVTSKYVQFRTRNVLSGPDDLCVTRNDEQGEKYELEECDDSEDRQLFRGFEADEDEKFALNPKVAVDDGRDRCVTMNHRPRSNGDYNGDKIYDQKCCHVLGDPLDR